MGLLNVEDSLKIWIDRYHLVILSGLLIHRIPLCFGMYFVLLRLAKTVLYLFFFSNILQIYK